MVGASNGWHRGSQSFACPEGRAVFVPFANVRADTRFGRRKNHSERVGDEQDVEGGFGGMDCPVVTGFHTPIKVRR